MYQCNYCRGTDIVCEAKVKLNNDVDEKGYYSISEVEELDSVYCNQCESSSISTINATKFSLQ